MKGTKIEWTHTFLPDGSTIPGSTWNPFRGCTVVSPGCVNCYAKCMSARFNGPGQPYEGIADFVVRSDGSRTARWTGKISLVEKHLTDPLRTIGPGKIFVNSMSDTFHEDVPASWIDRVFAVMYLTHWKTFQVLTKRPERMFYALSDRDMKTRVQDAAIKILSSIHRTPLHMPPFKWPLPNVWCGVSAESNFYLCQRAPWLLRTPAAIRFLSAEPLLGPLPSMSGFTESGLIQGPGLDWVITGGESDFDARPCSVNWVRNIRDTCRDTHVAYFHKQWGQWLPGEWVDGRHVWQSDAKFNPVQESVHHFEDGSIAVKCARKSNAGRRLDGIEYNQYPGDVERGEP